MKLLFLAVLLYQSLALDVHPEPLAQNMVTRFLNGFLNRVFEKLSTDNASIPLVDLKEVGNFSDVIFSASGLNKILNGYRTQGFNLSINANRVMVGGQYHIVHLDVPHLFPVFGKGHFSVELEKVGLKTILDARRDFGEEKFNFTLLELTIQVQGSKVKFDNLMDDPHLADFLNELISNLVPGLAPYISEQLKATLPPALNKYGNGIYNCLPKVTQEKILECIKELFFPSKLILEELATSLTKALMAGVK